MEGSPECANNLWIPCKARQWYSTNQSEQWWSSRWISVNAFQAQTIGESLIQWLAGNSVFDYKFQKKDMAIIIKTNASDNIEDNVVDVDLLVINFA